MKHPSLGNILTILGMLGAMAAGWATLAGENATQKERVDNIKKEAAEIKQDVKETKENVQLILRKMEAAEAVRAAERRAERRTPPR